MTRLILILLLMTSTVACTDDRVVLERGPLGPATYEVTFGVTGDPAVKTDPVTATLEVQQRPGGATLSLDVGAEVPVVTEFTRSTGGRLVLETVQGVSPSSAGEADLASIVGQLDPPLAGRAVRIGEGWSARRRIETDILEASLTTRLEVARFSRVAGHDTAQLEGTVRGALRTTGPAGTFSGRVEGDTRIDWAVRSGRVAASETVLRWTIVDLGTVTLRTRVRPLSGL